MVPVEKVDTHIYIYMVQAEIVGTSLYGSSRGGGDTCGSSRDSGDI